MSEPMITLSDGSVWHYRGDSSWRCGSGHWPLYACMPTLAAGTRPLTAADHRKIADVLDPPLPPQETPV